MYIHRRTMSEKRKTYQRSEQSAIKKKIYDNNRYHTVVRAKRPNPENITRGRPTIYATDQERIDARRLHNTQNRLRKAYATNPLYQLDKDLNKYASDNGIVIDASHRQKIISLFKGLFID
jgi:hypothetical protein